MENLAREIEIFLPLIQIVLIIGAVGMFVQRVMLGLRRLEEGQAQIQAQIEMLRKQNEQTAVDLRLLDKRLGHAEESLRRLIEGRV